VCREERGSCVSRRAWKLCVEKSVEAVCREERGSCVSSAVFCALSSSSSNSSFVLPLTPPLSLTFLVVANICTKSLAEYMLLNSKYYRRLVNEYSPGKTSPPPCPHHLHDHTTSMPSPPPCPHHLHALTTSMPSPPPCPHHFHALTTSMPSPLP
jgi:hypothetical protein